MRRGRLRLEWSTSATRIRIWHQAVADVGSRTQIPVTHAHALSAYETRISAEYGLFDHLAIATVVPYRIVDASTSYVDGEGNPVEPAGDHGAGDSLRTGVGDPWLLAHVGVRHAPWRLDVRVGASLPLGAIQLPPVEHQHAGHERSASEETVLEPETFPFGTGTVNPLLELQIARSFGPLQLSLWGWTEQVLYQNVNGYQPGSRYAGGLIASSHLNSERWGIWGGPETQAQRPELWRGVVHDDGIQDRFDLVLSAGGSFQASTWLEFRASVRVPVYTRATGGEVSYPLLATLGAAVQFELFGKQ
jgi:hypothetical protein